LKPPYSISNTVLALVASIAEKVGEINAAKLDLPPTELRKRNRIKTIQASLAIEGNQMTEGQVTDLLENRRVLAPERDILEVKNAIEVYQRLAEWDVYSISSLCQAHQILMQGLVEGPGRFRGSTVGIMKGQELGHIAPPGRQVHALMDGLFDYLAHDKELLLIKSCVFHYEFEFIHPFLDGNGRMGRLWQTLILREYSTVFGHLPVEVLIKEQQEEYYQTLENSDKLGDSTSFIEFMLSLIDRALEDLLRTQRVTLSSSERITRFRDRSGNSSFTRMDYLRANKQISPATASRDLSYAVSQGLVKKIGDKRTSTYTFIQ